MNIQSLFLEMGLEDMNSKIKPDLVPVFFLKLDFYFTL